MRLFVDASQEEPVVIKRKIELKYKVFGKKRSEDSTMNAGSLIVSAVFQPIESVGKSGEVTTELDIRSRELKPSDQRTVNKSIDKAPLENVTEALRSSSNHIKNLILIDQIMKIPNLFLVIYSFCYMQLFLLVS